MKHKSLFIILLSTLLLAGCKDNKLVIGDLVLDFNSKSESTTTIATTTIQSTVAGPVELIEPVEPAKSGPIITLSELDKDKRTFTLNFDYEDFIVEEQYYYSSEEEFKRANITILPMKGVSLIDIISELGEKCSIENCQAISDNKYIYDSEGLPQFFEAAQYSSMTEAYDLAKGLVKETKSEVSISTPYTGGDMPLILSTSKSTFSLEKMSLRIKIGETKQIAVSQCPAGYEEKIFWVSSNPAFVTVDQYGNVTGHANGSATINASLEGAGVYQSILVFST